MIYNKNGSLLNEAFSIAGQLLTSAFNVSGLQVYPDSVTIKVMSYNVGEWYYGAGDNVPSDKDAEYYALQNGMIEANDPDVLCIQEYWKIFSKAGRTAKSMLEQYFPYIIEQGGDSGYYGHCICSKYPISNYVQRHYTDNNQRYYDSCTITISGIPVTFINTHLDVRSQENRTAEIGELLAFMATQTRVILCGDFNTGIGTATANTESTPYVNNVKPFIDAGYHSANFSDFGFMVTCIDRLTDVPYYLDNIYTSSNITIDNAEVDETKLNDLINDPIDHMPLIATLTI